MLLLVLDCPRAGPENLGPRVGPALPSRARVRARIGWPLPGPQGPRAEWLARASPGPDQGRPWPSKYSREHL